MYPSCQLQLGEGQYLTLTLYYLDDYFIHTYMCHNFGIVRDVENVN